MAGKPPVHLMGLPPSSADGDPTQNAARSGLENNVALWIRHRDRLVVYAAACASLDGLAEAFDDADVLFFDGTFWSSDELVAAGLSRARAEDMAHLPVGGDKGSLAGLARSRARRKIYTHINNTNPILVEGSPEHDAVRAAGWEVAFDGMEIDVVSVSAAPLTRDEFVARLRAEGERATTTATRSTCACTPGSSRARRSRGGRSTATTTRRASPSKTRSSSRSPRTRRSGARGSAASTITTAARDGRRRPRAVAAARRRGRARRGRGEELRARPAGGALRLRRVRAARARALARRGGRVVAHRVLLARHHDEAARGLGEALPVGRPRRAGVLPQPRPARARRLGGGARVRGRATRRRASSQERCVAAFITKCDILWCLLDAVAASYS